VGYSIFPATSGGYGGPTAPSLQHTVTSSGTITLNGTPTTMYAIVYGGGGGSGGTGGSAYVSSGASAGGSSGGVIMGVVPPILTSVLVGAAGSAGASGAGSTGATGGRGGTSSFGGLIATGGYGGQGGTTNGAAGTASTTAGLPAGVLAVGTTGGVIIQSGPAGFSTSTYCSGADGVGVKLSNGNAGKQGVVYIYY